LKGQQQSITKLIVYFVTEKGQELLDMSSHVRRCLVCVINVREKG